MTCPQSRKKSPKETYIEKNKEGVAKGKALDILQKELQGWGSLRKSI